MTDDVNVPRAAVKAVLDALDLADSDSAFFGSDHYSDLRVVDDALAAAPEAEPVEADDFGDTLLAFLFRHGLKVALDVSEIEALRQSAIRAQPEAPKVEQEPFGHWVEHTVGEPVFIRNGSYVPKGENYTVTHLYTHPAPASDELLEALGGGDVIALVDPERCNHPDAPQLAYAHGWNDAIAKQGPQS